MKIKVSLARDERWPEILVSRDLGDCQILHLAVPPTIDLPGGDS